MQKNVAGQKIGAQMIDATTGAAFASTVTVYVTGDAGTQAIGSVGSGICTNEGNGYYTYAPAQAETNYDLIAFTFTGTGAIPATIQCFTSSDANLKTILGTAVSSPATAGILDVNVKNVNNVSASSVTAVNANIGVTQPVNFTGTGGSALVKSDMVDVAGAAVSASTAQLGVNVVNWKGSAAATVDSAGYPVVTIKDGTGQGEIALTSGAIDTVTTTTTATNLTNAPTNGDLTATMKTSVTTAATAATPVATSVSGNVGGNVVGSVGSVSSAVTVGTINASASNIKKNADLDAFSFVMTDSTTHLPMTGLTVVAERSIDGAAFGACANSVSELSDGVYLIDLAAADLNGDVITLKFTATAADPRIITFITQP